MRRMNENHRPQFPKGAPLGSACAALGRFALLCCVALPAAAAETPAPQATAASPEAVPALPAPATDAPPASGTPAPTSSATTPTSDELQKLKAQLKAEIEAELRAELQNEMSAAARDTATQTAADKEWQEEKWVEEMRPTLNFLELDGYFRTRFDLFNRLDLGTFDPNVGNGVGRGTSSVPPPTWYRPFDGDTCTDQSNFDGDTCSTTKQDTSTLLSLNMRLRLDPTFNISDDIRLRTTVDVFDNVVMGGTTDAMAANPSVQLPFLSDGQGAAQAGVNAMYDAIRFKRLWAEVMTPFGELRFGRQAMHFGLGLLMNDGNKLNNNYGDSADMVSFASRVAGHYIVPAYSVTSSGAAGRGGGAGLGGDDGRSFYPAEAGQRYNLDFRDDVHSFMLTVAKKDKEEDIEEALRQGGIVFNYGAFGTYRLQQYDVPAYYTAGNATVTNPIVQPEQYVKRDANMGLGSLWARFQWDKLKIEAEATGVFGVINGTSTNAALGTNANDPELRVVDGNKLKDSPLWLLQGGAAVESSYKFLNDQLSVGLDGGIASGDDAFGFGLRPGYNKTPRAGDFDGQQYGQCLERDPDGKDRDDDGDIDCQKVDDNITNFRFDPDYQVDLILFREILGTVSDAAYIKPHIGYALTENMGARADVIYSHALYASSTPGLQNPIGLELDGTAYYGTADGFFLMAQYGFFLPFGALSNSAAGVDQVFVQPQFAQTLRVFGGVQF